MIGPPIFITMAEISAPTFLIDFWVKYCKKTQKSAFLCILRGLYNVDEGARVLRNKDFGEYGIVGPIKIFWGMCTPQAHCVICLRKQHVKKLAV